MSARTKIVSFYLPQFHSDPVNDKWHGRGFTEWDKVKPALPLFEGHVQPQTPHPDIGYYDLATPEPMYRQAEQMKKYGIDAQMIYLYWFQGKMILERPAIHLKERPDIPMDFAFCWANHDWTLNWDGGSRKVILEQTYSVEDAQNLFYFLLPYFRDPRYLKIQGRPVWMILLPEAIPDIDRYFDLWNGLAVLEGIEPPYFIGGQNKGHKSREISYPVRALVQRPLINFDWLAHEGSLRNWASGKEYKNFAGTIFEYDEVVDFYKSLSASSTMKTYPSVLPGWDVSPRHGSNSLVVRNFNIDAFESWLLSSIRQSEAIFSAGERLVFINAWNEWAEGAYLEPDEILGYAKLEAVARAKFSAERGEVDFD